MRRLLFAGVLLVVSTPASASISATLLSQGQCTAAFLPGATCDSTSITPVSGQLMIVAWNETNHNGGTLTGTNGLGVTWTSMNFANGLSVHRGIPSSGTAGVFTFGTGGGFGPGTVRWIVVTLAGVNQATNQGVVQAVRCGLVSTTCTPAMAALTRSDDMVLLAASVTSNADTTCTPKAGYTQIAIEHSTTDTDGTVCLQYGYDNTPSATLGVGNIEALGVELLSLGSVRHRVIQQ